VILVTLSSTATALLLWRAWRLAGADTSSSSVHPGWVLLAVAGWTVPWAWAASRGLAVGLSAAKVWDATWPLLLAGALIAVLAPRLRAPAVPEGDIVVPLERLTGAVVGVLAAAGRALGGVRVPRGSRAGGLAGIVGRIEIRLRRLPVTGLVLLGTGAAVWLLLRLIDLS